MASPTETSAPETSAPDPGAPPAGTVAMVAFDDGLVAVHLLPVARAAVAAGYRVAVLTPHGAGDARIEAAGARAVALALGEIGLNPMRTGYAAGQLSGMLRALKADLVHCAGLGAVLVGGAAAAMAGIGPRVYALPGLGSAPERRDVRSDLRGRLVRGAIRAGLRGPLAGARTRLLLDGAEAARALGLDPLDTALRIAEDADALARTATALYAELTAP